MTYRLFGYALALAMSALLWCGLISLGGCATTPYFIRPPGPYNRGEAVVTLTVSHQQAITHHCTAQGLTPAAIACANPRALWMPDPCQFGGAYADLMCHELGHVRGWPANHIQAK